MLKSEIKIKNGNPCLYIDGQPTTAMAYTTYFEERSCCASFAGIGCRLFFVNTSFTALPINSFSTGFSPFRVGVFENINSPDYSEFEREVHRILKARPSFRTASSSAPSRTLYSFAVQASPLGAMHSARHKTSHRGAICARSLVQAQTQHRLIMCS